MCPAPLSGPGSPRPLTWPCSSSCPAAVVWLTARPTLDAPAARVDNGEVTTTAAPRVVQGVPLASPRFLLGADYEMAVRVGTRMRWSQWSPPIHFSLAIHPPVPPVSCA